MMGSLGGEGGRGRTPLLVLRIVVARSAVLFLKKKRDDKTIASVVRASISSMAGG